MDVSGGENLNFIVDGEFTIDEWFNSIHLDSDEDCLFVPTESGNFYIYDVSNPAAIVEH